MKKLLYFFFLIATTTFIHAQSSDTTAQDTTYWKKGGNISVIFNQIAFSNWAKGGENSIASTGLFNYFINYNKDKWAWDNKVELGYGFQYTDEFDYRKTEDQIAIDSKLGYRIKNPSLYLAALIGFNSQFDNGYNFPDDTTVISKFMSPGYIRVSLGLDYKPNEYFTFYLSPSTGQFIIVNDQRLADQGAFGVQAAIRDENGNIIQEGENLEAQFGAYFTANYNQDLMENINLKSTLTLFNDYTDDDVDNRKNIDVDWQSTLSMKVNDYISTNFFFHVIYDHNIPVPITEEIDGEEVIVREGPRTQIKQILGVGFAYKF